MNILHILSLSIVLNCGMIKSMEKDKKIKEKERTVSMAAPVDQKKNQHTTMDTLRDFIKPLTKKKSKDHGLDNRASMIEIYPSQPIVVPQESVPEVFTQQSPPTRNVTRTNSFDKEKDKEGVTNVFRSSSGEEKPFQTINTAHDLKDLEIKSLLSWWNMSGRKSRPDLILLLSFLAESTKVQDAIDEKFKKEGQHTSMHILCEQLKELFTKLDYGLTEQEKENKEIYESILIVKKKKRSATTSKDDIFGSSPDS